MKPGTLAPRVLALLVSISLALPPSAVVYAEPSRSTLREQQKKEQPRQLAGLEAALKDPDAALQKVVSYLAQPFGATPTPVAPAAGLEASIDWPGDSPLLNSPQVRAKIRQGLDAIHQQVVRDKETDENVYARAHADAQALYYENFGVLNRLEDLLVSYAVAHYAVLEMAARHARGMSVYGQYLDWKIGDLERLRGDRFWQDWPDDPILVSIRQALKVGHALRAALQVPRLEQVTPSELIHGWSRLDLTQQDKRRIRDQLRRIDRDLLGRLMHAAQHPVNPPDTLYEVVAQALGRPQGQVRQLIESLGPEAYQPPETIPIGESEAVGWDEETVRQQLEGHVITLGAGGGGRRFKGSLTPAYRAQLERLNRFEKPLALIGPSGISPVVNALEEISALADRVGAREVHVVVVTSEEADQAIRQDIARNGGRFDRRRVKVHIVQPEMFPSFHEESRKILTTQSIDPSDPKPRIRKNPSGTYGVFAAAYRQGQRQGFGAGKGMLVLYGDDPILNSGGFIARALSAGRDLDVAPVVIRKTSRLYPPGGTVVDLRLQDGRRLPLIVEKAERDPDPKRGVPGLPAFNRVEDEASERGENRYGFNTGVLKLSAQAVQKAAELAPQIKYRHAIRDGILQLELFLTHIPTLVGVLPQMRYGALSVDDEQYGAVKNMAGVAQALVTQDQRSRRLLEQLPGARQLRLHPQAVLDLRPGFRGFSGDGVLAVETPAGVVLGPEGVTVVPVVGYEPALFEIPDRENPTQLVLRRIDHPIFSDPRQAPLRLPADAGVVTLSEDQVAALPVPEPTPYQRLLDRLSEPALRAIARSGVTSLEALLEKTRVDFLKMEGVYAWVVDEIESALSGAGRALNVFNMAQASPGVLTGDPQKDPILRIWAESLSAITPKAPAIFLEQAASYQQRVTREMGGSLDKIHYSRAAFEDSVLRALWEQSGEQPSSKLQGYLARRIFDALGEAELYGSARLELGPLQDAQGVIRIPAVFLPHLIDKGFVRLVREEPFLWGLTSAHFQIVLVKGVTVTSLWNHLSALSAGLEAGSPVSFEPLHQEDLAQIQRLDQEEQQRRDRVQPSSEQRYEFLADGRMQEKGEAMEPPRWRARWVGSRWESDDVASYLDEKQLQRRAFGLWRQGEGSVGERIPLAFVAFRWTEEGVQMDHLLIHPDEPTRDRFTNVVNGLSSLRHPRSGEPVRLITALIPTVDRDAFELFRASGFQQEGTFESPGLDVVETRHRLVYRQQAPSPSAGLETIEAQAQRIVEEVAGIIDGKVRRYPYGLAPLLPGGEIVISQRRGEGGEALYDVQFREQGLRRTMDGNGFFRSGSISSERAVAIAELIQARAQRIGMGRRVQVMVKQAATPTWASDFFVEVQAGSYREVLSATPAVPTRGATFGEPVGVYPPKRWGPLRGRRFQIGVGGEGPKTVPMAWIPLDDGEHAVLILAGVDAGDGRPAEPDDLETLQGLNRPFRLLYEGILVRVATGEGLAGRSLAVRIPKGQLRSLRSVLSQEARANILQWFEGRAVSVKDVFYTRTADAGWEAASEDALLPPPLQDSFDKQYSAYDFILYDLFAALETWPAAWDTAAAGLEQASPLADWQDWQRGVILPLVSEAASAVPAVGPLETAQALALADTAWPAAVMAARRYASREDVRSRLAEAGGVLPLPAGVARDLSNLEDASGGLLLSGQAAAQARHQGIIVMDADITHRALEQLAAVVKPGTTPDEILQALAGLAARAGDLIVLEADEELSNDPHRIRSRIAHSLPGVVALPRAIVGPRAEIQAMPVVAFGTLAEGEYPDVVFIGMAFTFQDAWRQEHSLVVFTQV